MSIPSADVEVSNGGCLFSKILHLSMCLSRCSHGGPQFLQSAVIDAGTLIFLSASATTRRQSPSPYKLQVCMQLVKAFSPATGSAQASSHSCFAVPLPLLALAPRLVAESCPLLLSWSDISCAEAMTSAPSEFGSVCFTSSEAACTVHWAGAA